MTLNGHAQDSLLLRDYQFVKLNDPWLTSCNAAGLTRYATENITKAELSLTKGKGGFTDFYQSPDVLQADAGIESFFRINPRTVVFGSVSYNNFSGKDMAGSAFINPSHKPFDLVEDSLTNTGTKHRDTYHLYGGVALGIGKGYAVGLSLDYTAANYAKYKDLRHKNKLMDMVISAGIYMPLASWFDLGANYLYHRNTESLSFSTYGREDKVYKTFINYGPYIGQIEQFGSSGYTDKSNEMPLVDDYNGAGLQMSVSLAPGLSFYHAFSYAHRTGYYGRKSPYTITYTQHHSDLLSYDARITLRNKRSVYKLDLSLQSENLENNANTYREQTNENGAHFYEYYTAVKAANRLWKDASISLTGDFGIRHELPTWMAMAGIRQSKRQQTAYLYPYYRRQDITSTEFMASLSRHIASQKGVWTFSAQGIYKKGSGDPFEDFTFATPSDKQTAPATMEAYLYREYQYMTAAQYIVSGSVKYAFIFPGTRIKSFALTTVSHHKANTNYDYCNGKDHTAVTLAIGCLF